MKQNSFFKTALDDTHLSPKYLANTLQTECIWVANSLAGTRINPTGPDSLGAKSGCAIMCRNLETEMESKINIEIYGLR